MKKLIALCAVMGFTAQASAQTEINHNGSFRLQYINNDNVGFADTSASHDWSQRFQWGMNIKAGEAVSLSTKFVHASVWGNNASDQIPGGGSGSNTTEDNALIVNEAKASWQISDEMMASFGRGSYTVADGTVVASNEWEQVQKAFDGGIYSYDHEMARISLFGVRGATSANTARNYGNFTGLSVDFKALPEFLKMANLHYISVKRDDGVNIGVALGEEDTSRIGLTLGGDTAGVDYRLTYAMYDGETSTTSGIAPTDVSATMLDAEVGYSMPETMNLRVSVLYHMDSGDDNAADTESNTYSGFHYDAHNNAGLMDVLGWGNLTYLKAAVTLDPSENMTVGLAYYMFTATEAVDASYGPGATPGISTALIAANGANTEDELGSEIDLWVTHRYTSNFSITGWYSMFAAGDRIGTTNVEDRSQIYFAGNYTF